MIKETITAAGMLIAALATVKGCSLQPKKTIVYEDGGDCGDLAESETKKEQCPTPQTGVKIWVCRDKKIDLVLDNCADPVDRCPDKVTFSEVQGILTAKCVECHNRPRYDDFETAREKIDVFIERINAGVDERMPPEGKEPLPENEVRLLQKWKTDGTLLQDTCDDTARGGTISLRDLETAALIDAADLDANERQNVIWLTTAHKRNENRDEDLTETFLASINKSVNHLSNEDFLEPVRAVGANGTLFRVDLAAYGLTVNDWRLVEAADPFNLESFTDEGIQLKLLTGKRKPIMYFDVFNFTTHQNAPVYYALTRTPNTLDAFLRKIGVNAAGELREGTADFIGLFRSEISLQKNRLMVRFECDDAPNGQPCFTWITFDPIDVDGVNARNLTEAPLLGGTGGVSIFDFAASEVLYMKPNGTMGGALFNAAGEIQNAAPLNIVADNRSRLGDPEISCCMDCWLCHSGGQNPAADEVEAAALANPNIPARDKPIIDLLYKGADANRANFEQDNRAYRENIGRLGIDVSNDPMNFAEAKLRLNWDLDQVAAFFLTDPETFARILPQSSNGVAQIGQILQGETVTFGQMIEVTPTLLQDLRLFEEPL